MGVSVKLRPDDDDAMRVWTIQPIAVWEQLREKRLKEILETDTDTLFTIEEVEADIPHKARIVESAVCDQCGEPTKADLLQEIDDQKVCIPCAQRVSRKGRG